MTQTFEQWAESEGLDMSVDWKGDLTSPVTAGALRGWEAARSAGQEPIYQVRWHEGDPWVDIDGAMYATYADRMHDKRIVYAAPVNGGERAADAHTSECMTRRLNDCSGGGCANEGLIDDLRQIIADQRAADAQQVSQMSDRQIIELCKSVGVEWEGPDMCDFMGDFGRVNMAGMRAIIAAAKEQK